MTSVEYDLHLVSLGNLIVFLGNSVILLKIAYSVRGSSHTTQIWTLPIAVKQLPKDNKVTLDYHLEKCKGDPKCGCKDQIVLNKNDMARCRFHLSEEETAMQTLPTQHIFWYLSLLHLLNDSAERSTITIKGSEISSLDNSFQDLSIMEDPLYSAIKGLDQSCSDKMHAELDDLEK
ncbi:hypothetical protein CHS0354_019949 [Potamilus streckersoni]|uniref:Uncharacterized protein n=1 Tax=Potamilus streckersoni TaxID=2493646 RepID=A0AAE0S0A7_9BIVA|nr:hypothetical protein CHS0354_019949 [Potamilus streckersoni]